MPAGHGLRVVPIRPENRHRYAGGSPTSGAWARIRREVLERAGDRCEGTPAHPDCRAVNGAPHPATGSRVVLTIAHLDHRPENNAMGNLRALCQRCHLSYDRAHHRATALRTAGVPPTMDLF